MTAGLYTHKDECESVKNQKNKHTSHWYYLLLDNWNAWTVSEDSRETLKIATKTVILMRSNSVLLALLFVERKMPLLEHV